MSQLTAQERVQSRYIPVGFQERTFTTTNGKGFGVVYWQEFTNEIRGGTAFHAIAYRGRSGKPAWNYIFHTKDHMERTINEFFETVRTHAEYQQKIADERKNFVPAIKPGDILDTCWGYDQTNVEFFQVIRVTGKTAVLREISQKQVATTGPFSGSVIAVKDQFVDKEIMRRVMPGNSVKIDECRYASLWNGSPAHCSWGA